IIEGLMMANCTFPEATSQMAAGLSLANRFTGHRSDPCSRKLTRAWRYGQSLRFTSSAATSSINRDRVVCGWVRIRVGLKENSFELILSYGEEPLLNLPLSKGGEKEGVILALVPGTRHGQS